VNTIAGKEGIGESIRALLAEIEIKGIKHVNCFILNLVK